jgi:hypothetical protein
MVLAVTGGGGNSGCNSGSGSQTGNSKREFDKTERGDDGNHERSIFLWPGRVRIGERVRYERKKYGLVRALWILEERLGGGGPHE